jgi:hypothetical protein
LIDDALRPMAVPLGVKVVGGAVVASGSLPEIDGAVTWHLKVFSDGPMGGASADMRQLCEDLRDAGELFSQAIIVRGPVPDVQSLSLDAAGLLGTLINSMSANDKHKLRSVSIDSTEAAWFSVSKSALALRDKSGSVVTGSFNVNVALQVNDTQINWIRSPKEEFYISPNARNLTTSSATVSLCVEVCSKFDDKQTRRFEYAAEDVDWRIRSNRRSQSKLVKLKKKDGSVDETPIARSRTGGNADGGKGGRRALGGLVPHHVVGCLAPRVQEAVTRMARKVDAAVAAARVVGERAADVDADNVPGNVLKHASTRELAADRRCVVGNLRRALEQLVRLRLADVRDRGAVRRVMSALLVGSKDDVDDDDDDDADAEVELDDDGDDVGDDDDDDVDEPVAAADAAPTTAASSTSSAAAAAATATTSADAKLKAVINEVVNLIESEIGAGVELKYPLKFTNLAKEHLAPLAAVGAKVNRILAAAASTQRNPRRGQLEVEVPTAAYKFNLTPSHDVKWHQLDVEDLRQLLGMPPSAGDGKVLRAAIPNIDEIMRRRATSTWREERIESIKVCGTAVQLMLRSTSRAPAERGEEKEKLMSDLLAAHNQPSADVARRTWLQHRVVEEARTLYTSRSYMSRVCEALARRALASPVAQPIVALIAGSTGTGTSSNTSAKKAKVSASNETFGLGEAALAAVRVAPVRVDELGAGEYPQRAMVDGLLRARTTAAVRELLEKTIVSIDTGVKTLASMIVARPRVPANADDEVWSRVLDKTTDGPLSDDELEHVNSTLMFDFVARSVKGTQRFAFHEPVLSDAATRATDALTTAALKSGGWNALLTADREQYAREFEQHRTAETSAWRRGRCGRRGR